LLIRLFTQSLKIVSIFVVAGVIIGGSVVFFQYWTDRTASKEDGLPVTIQISEDDDTGSVAKKLADNDIINYTIYFEGRMRLSGGELRPGTYTLEKGMSVSDIIKQITVPESEESSGSEGDSTAGADQTLEFTFIEGQRIEEFATVAEEAGLPGGRQAFLDAANDPENRKRWDFLDDVPDSASLEGYLFPDTYVLGQGGTADSLIQLMLQNFDNRVTPEMRQQAQDQGLSLNDLVTVASLVEREDAVPEERPIVARVYLNRIDQDMSLDADPIYQYTVGDQGDGNWWPQINTALIEEARANGFDTYNEVGLPPTPIANPGLASIQAVLAPADVSYLYFVAKNDGSGQHVFAETYDEQLANTCEYNPDYEQCGGSGSTVDDSSVAALPDEPVLATGDWHWMLVRERQMAT
jgi:UPF0755 protein